MTKRCSKPVRSIPQWLAFAFACLPLAGCNPTGFNPFVDLPAVAMDGVGRLMEYDVAPLGDLATGQVIRVKVEGLGAQAVLILAADTENDDAGVLAGGGQTAMAFDYRVQVAGRYYVYVLFDPAASADERRATLTVSPGDPNYHPPQKQIVRVVFEDGYLTNPGLVDPTSFTQDEIQLLAGISDQVRQQVIERLGTIYTGTPIEIVTTDDPLPTGPYSVLTYTGRRKEPAAGDFFDVAVPPLLPEHPECQDRVIFGEVLDSALQVDAGNRMQSDRAAVYVGSFQGRGASCRTAATDSVNNIVLGLTHTGAHEIGHLVGLFHVSLTDIMNRSPSLAFQRELSFQPGQVLIETATDPFVLTSVIQDPAFYFGANFDPAP